MCIRDRLLCVQAACDLALPNYTSDIVDTGIQQQGVQDVAAEQLTGRTHDLVAMMLPEPEEQMFADAYAQNEDGTYSLTESGKRDRAALDDAMALPMTVTCYADQIAELDLDPVSYTHLSRCRRMFAPRRQDQGPPRRRHRATPAR